MNFSLPMYDADRPAVERYGRGLARAMARRGLAVDDAPGWPDDLPSHWRDPALRLSQTCGWPLTTTLAGRVQLVGAFRCAVSGCEGTSYRSAIVVRADDAARSIDDLRGRVAAINSPDSHSGHNALRALVAPLARDGRFFASAVWSGSHRRSLAFVQHGEADVAAIDCISLAGIERVDAAAMHGLHVIGHTALAPGLPLITSTATAANDLAALRAAVLDSFADESLDADRAALFLAGFEVLRVDDYAPIQQQAASARAFGVEVL